MKYMYDGARPYGLTPEMMKSIRYLGKRNGKLKDSDKLSAYMRQKLVKQGYAMKVSHGHIILTSMGQAIKKNIKATKN